MSLLPAGYQASKEPWEVKLGPCPLTLRAPGLTARGSH